MNDPGDEQPEKVLFSKEDLDEAFEDGLMEALRLLEKEKKRYLDKFMKRWKESDYAKGQHGGCALLGEIVSDDILNLLKKRGRLGEYHKKYSGS
jgi:hypothetical protein